MKRVLYIVITIFLMMIATSVKAETTLTKIVSDSKLKKGDMVEVTLKVNTDVHVRGFAFDYDFDHDKLEINDIRSDVSPVTWKTAQEISGSASAVATDAQTGEFNLAVLKFKVLEDFDKDEISTVTINALRVSDGVLVETLGSSTIDIVGKETKEEPVVVPIKNDEEEKKEEEKKGEIKPIDTGVTLPVLSVSLLGGAMLIFKKSKGMLFRI